MHNSGASRREIAEVYLDVIACDKREAFAQGSEATKQSIFFHGVAMDCFAEPVIGRAFARPVGSQ
jgi:hypothetical protein